MYSLTSKHIQFFVPACLTHISYISLLYSKILVIIYCFTIQQNG